MYLAKNMSQAMAWAACMVSPGLHVLGVYVAVTGRK